MNPVPGTFGFDQSKQGHPKQRQIADDVDDLVTYKLIIEAKAFAIEDTALGRQHDRVVQRASPGEAHPSKFFDLIQKPEGPRRSHLLGKLAVG